MVFDKDTDYRDEIQQSNKGSENAGFIQKIEEKQRKKAIKSGSGSV
jgi:hypothetical protein